MRCCPARALVLALACVAVWRTLIHAQSSIPSENETAQTAGICPQARSAHDRQPNGREISIAGLLGSSGSLQVPISDQDQIAASLAQRTYAGSLDEVKEDVEERLRNEWQKRGYFKVRMSADGNVLTIGPSRQQIVLTVYVEEGAQYHLERIAFKNNKAVTNAQALRTLFALKDGDIFDREAVAMGLKNLAKAYGQMGYINFTSVPNTNINEDAHTISLEIDVDEGKQFYVSSIDIKGAEAQRLNDLALTPGQIYNERLVELFLQKCLPGADVSNLKIEHRLLDERNGTVALTFDFRQCLAD